MGKAMNIRTATRMEKTRKQAIAISAVLVVVLLGISSTFIALNFGGVNAPPVVGPGQEQPDPDPTPTTPAMMMPVNGSAVVLKAANFNMLQWNRTAGWYEFDLGFTLGAEAGTAVVAAYGGTVREVISGGNNSTGKLVRIEHANGLHTVYSSLGSIEVEVGQTVAKGERIGTVGNTSYAERFDMPVVRFETFEMDGTRRRAVNPDKFVEFPNVVTK